ncbi:MAG TPA: spermidine/putrescine ABC transporter substrate-binding protein PotF, partial [Xanthobacteraceae bacterium]|nr:spermidine/putrescine ABC transporter substrate-binding protein PotF [Xanthobacteraceae bacterium]
MMRQTKYRTTLKRWAGLVAAGLALCLWVEQGRAQEARLNVYNWNDYIAEDTIRRFEAETGIKVHYDVYDANETLDTKLRAGRTGYDLVVPTASPFLALQIPAHLYRPLDHEKLKNYGNLDRVLMSQLATYDPGNRHAIPWMWGTIGVGYNSEAVKRIMPAAPV